MPVEKEIKQQLNHKVASASLSRLTRISELNKFYQCHQSQRHPRLNFPDHLGRVFWYGRTHLTGLPLWRFPQEPPHLSSLQREYLWKRLWLVFESLSRPKHFQYLYSKMATKQFI